MRGSLTAFVLGALLAGAPASAESGAVAQFSGFSVNAADGTTVMLEASKAPLWSGEAETASQAIEPARFSGQVTLDFALLGEGDVAGLALYHDPDHWLSIQVERIEPADLIAVRLHDGPGGVTAGRLIFTTALGGSFERKVRLRIDGADGKARLLFAEQRGLWQVLAEDVPIPASASDGASLAVFATDGADPPTTSN